ncbi:MAG: bifunctional demethylmenaquinone methyltransferase/2-methoxy-6-polyprenyl-1,4-benzoquinol methylase UbiE [Bacteroidales bacterium]|nr:bifunctional demethylmenaquinone methyltransferase/2-methoxy-6-polyprenyl-1,4-benzoquinol methylase UbiE [Bacteroidales bacterium]
MKKEVENIVPYNREERKTDQVRTMFNNIAPNYDRFNHTASMGIDRYWRRKGILTLKAFEPKDILDVATGTGDYAINAFNLLHPDKITGIDLSTGMMEIGEKKVSSLGLSEKISFKQEDCTSLSFDNDSFDAVIAAFGVRNFENMEAGYAEMFRVMRPGGHLSILELTTPTSFPMKQMYHFYAKTVIPFLGKSLSNDKRAYEYLPESIAAVPQFATMTQILTKVGFQNAHFESLTFGICCLYTAEKPKDPTTK